jgi:hypothetical protein
MIKSKFFFSWLLRKRLRKHVIAQSFAPYLRWKVLLYNGGLRRGEGGCVRKWGGCLTAMMPQSGG